MDVKPIKRGCMITALVLAVIAWVAFAARELKQFIENLS